MKTLSVDFDGVINSYKSGWTGSEGNIPDPPVEGALLWLEEMVKHFTVAIYSSRSRSNMGRMAMRGWLQHYGLPDHVLGRIEFPDKKPPAWLTVDDRAWCFTGRFPTVEEIESFRPWYKCEGEPDIYKRALVEAIEATCANCAHGEVAFKSEDDDGDPVWLHDPDDGSFSSWTCPADGIHKLIPSES